MSNPRDAHTGTGRTCTTIWVEGLRSRARRIKVRRSVVKPATLVLGRLRELAVVDDGSEKNNTSKSISNTASPHDAPAIRRMMAVLLAEVALVFLDVRALSGEVACAMNNE